MKPLNSYSRLQKLDSALFQLLLGPQVACVATSFLPAVGGPGVEAGVALPADHLVTVVLLGQDTKRGLNDSSTQTQHLRNNVVFVFYN